MKTELWPKPSVFNHSVILACVIEDPFFFCMVGGSSTRQCSVLTSCLFSSLFFL